MVAAAALVASLGLTVAPAEADAGFGSNFELDKNTVDAVDTAPDDWDSVYQQITADADDVGADDRCAALGADECAFVPDPQGQSIFTTGGSKDDLDISSWRHTTGSVPPKDEITNAYAAKYTVGSNQFLYFGADRYAVSGAADFGFWFFKNPVTANLDGTFSGAHDKGDVLILGTFTQGGATADTRVFTWVGTGGTATANGTVSPAGPESTFGDCSGAPPDADGCGTSNNGQIEVAWQYVGKAGTSTPGKIPAGGFVEGGIDLTALKLGGCFANFVAETRSSPSVDAQLKDFVLGTFEPCGSTLVTTPSDASGAAIPLNSATPPSRETSIGTGTLEVRDSAQLSVTGVNTWSGSLSFFLCKIESGTCETGGTPVGSPLSVNQATTQPILSPTATVTAAGRYCWRGVFTSATAGVPNATDASAGECFTVKPVTPKLSTSAVATVPLGQPISDTATVTGTASRPGTTQTGAPAPINPAIAGTKAAGSITFTLYGPNDGTCSKPAVHTSAAVPVSGDGSYSSGSYTPTVAGAYRWVASYTGDLPNTLSASGACNDENERSDVAPRQPEIATLATDEVTLGNSISDKATLSNTAPRGDGTAAQGSITFTVYGPDDSTCSGTPVFTSVPPVPVLGDGTYSSGGFTPTAAGTYRWIASYSGDLPNTLPVSGACNDAGEASVVITLQPEIATKQTFVPNDAATITVAEGGGALAGTAVFKLYVNDATCSKTAAYTSEAISITGEGSTGTALSRTVLSKNTKSFGTTGTTFHWTVTYTSTNTGHKGVTSPCGVEHSSITMDDAGTPATVAATP